MCCHVKCSTAIRSRIAAASRSVRPSVLMCAASPRGSGPGSDSSAFAQRQCTSPPPQHGDHGHLYTSSVCATRSHTELSSAGSAHIAPKKEQMHAAKCTTARRLRTLHGLVHGVRGQLGILAQVPQHLDINLNLNLNRNLNLKTQRQRTHHGLVHGTVASLACLRRSPQHLELT